MQSPIPSASEVRSRLQSISATDMEALAVRTNVPITTLIKVRNGQTANPRLETVRQIWPELIGAPGAPIPAEQQEAA